MANETLNCTLTSFYNTATDRKTGVGSGSGSTAAIANANAKNAANANATITVLRNVTEDDQTSVTMSKALTLNLNGKTLTKDRFIQLSANNSLVVKGSGTINGNGTQKYLSQLMKEVEYEKNLHFSPPPVRLN